VGCGVGTGGGDRRRCCAGVEVVVGVMAMPCGLVPVEMGLPAMLVATVMGVTVSLPWLVT
jgi:hypothetical protein